MKPPRVDNFHKLHYLPDPTFEDNRWLNYSELYGVKPTTDASRPMVQAVPQGKQDDDRIKDMLVTGINIYLHQILMLQ